MGRRKGCPSALGGHWFGDAASESYHILKSSCAGLPPRSPHCPRLPQAATPSAWPASSGADGACSAESPASLGIYGSASSVHDLSVSALSSTPKVPSSQPASLRCLSLNLHPRSLRSMTLPSVLRRVALHKRWEDQCGGVQGSEVFMGLAAGSGFPSLRPLCVYTHARMWLGFRGGVSRTAVADVQIRGSA